MVAELTVIIKDEEKSLRTKSLVHETFAVSDSDPIIAHHIACALKEFQGEPTDINIKISMCVR